ncbi:MAG: hypothetical protein ACRENE_35110 [Polyangiaceae bacterium]
MVRRARRREGLNGICDASGNCATCSTSNTGIDTLCTNAYGGGSAANPYVCVGGSCQPGNCTGNAACTSVGLPTCGFSTPNMCGGCTSDSQCPSGDVCVTVTPDAGTSVMGQCVAATAAGCAFSALGIPSACPFNPADECCPGLGACYPGNCCITAGVGSMCAGAGVSCKAESPGDLNGGGLCSACAAVTGTNPTYFVDPVRGNDATGTGNTSSGTAPGCAFKTITRALQVLGASPPTGTSINVVGGVNDAGTTTISTGETYPITLNANTTLTTSGGAIVIEVPAKTGANQTIGIVLGGNLSGITSGMAAALTIDGQSQTATTGVVVRSPSVTIAGITVQNFATEAVLVANAGSAASALTIGPGTHLNGNKVDGLLIQGTSSATVSATSSTAAPILFNANSAHGVRVTGQGVLTMSGSLGSSPPSTSTVLAQGNGTAGIWVQTTSTTQSSISAVASTGSATGNGIRIIPGSNVRVRGSWLLGNSQGSGVDVENSGGTVTSVSNIDLGSGASPGNNILQAASGNNPNGAAGICLRLPAGSSATLAAQGNVFRGVNCATSAGTLITAAARGCGGGPDVGGSLVALDAGAGDKIDVTMCSYQ